MLINSRLGSRNKNRIISRNRDDASIVWILQDDFTDTRAAGAVDDTAATPGPGVRDVVTDTNSKITVGSGVLDFATGAAANDGAWYEVVTRAAGKSLLAEITLADTNGIAALGFDTNQAGAITDTLLFSTTTGIRIIPNAGAAITIGAYTATTYDVAAIMRAAGVYLFIKGGTFTNWSLLYFSIAGTGNGYPAITAQNGTSVFTADFLRVPLQTWLPTPIAYDTFTRANGAIGSTEASGPDAQVTPVKAWTGATWTIATNKAVNTPTLGSDVIVNGDFATDSDWNKGTGWSIGSGVAAKTAGAGAGLSAIVAPLTIGVWYQINYDAIVSAGSVTAIFGGVSGISRTSSGSFFDIIRVGTAGIQMWGGGTFAGNVDNIITKPLTLSTLFSSLDASKTDVAASADVVLTAGTQAGLVTNLDSAGTPANFLIAYHDGTNAHLEKCVAGTYTSLINTAATYDAGTAIQLHTYRDGADLKCRLYYDDAFIGTEQTVSDAGIIDNVLHGLFSTYSANTLDNFTLFPRGQNDASYQALDRFTQ